MPSLALEKPLHNLQSHNFKFMSLRCYDAHNHLQDDRFAGLQESIIAACRAAGVTRMVVNGACESDWPQVQTLARSFPDLIQPSFGYHPWYLHERTPNWQATLETFLNETPHAVIGEIGLDRWKSDLPYARQEEMFTAQLHLAAVRDLPASIHCLQTWGRLHELLCVGPRPRAGFLLHSYGGPVEMVAPLAKLGAYFSFPGYFAHARKARQCETFRHIPSDRLLIETDAPDQLPPDILRRHTLSDNTLNHPANLAVIYEFLADFLQEPLATLSARVEENFQRLFE